MAVGESVCQGVSGDDLDPVALPAVGDVAAGDVGGDRQFEHGGAQVRVAAGGGDRPGPGASTDVEQAVPAGQVDHAGEGVGRSGGGGFDAGGHDYLLLVVEVEDLCRWAAGEGGGVVHRRRVADPLPEPEQRAEVGGRLAGEERGGGGRVGVVVAVAFEQAERDHRVGADVRRPGREAGAGCERVECGPASRLALRTGPARSRRTGGWRP